jgi:hypothetical protein
MHSLPLLLFGPKKTIRYPLSHNAEIQPIKRGNNSIYHKKYSLKFRMKAETENKMPQDFRSARAV